MTATGHVLFGAVLAWTYGAMRSRAPKLPENHQAMVPDGSEAFAFHQRLSEWRFWSAFREPLGISCLPLRRLPRVLCPLSGTLGFNRSAIRAAAEMGLA